MSDDTPVTDDTVRAEVLHCAHRLHELGLVAGTAGNVSGRMPNGHVVMTPSSLPYETMTLDQLVEVDLDGEVVAGTTSPSTEKALHLDCYRAYPEVSGVIHSHPLYCSMFAVAREPIPAVIEEVTVFLGGDLPVCEYQMTGTDELGREVASKLGDRSVALMANHGVVAVGKSTEDALHSTIVAERTAQIVWGARLLGTQHSVPEKNAKDFENVYKLIREMMWTARGPS
jgi:L-fuculose-phosphate aldolase